MSSISNIRRQMKNVARNYSEAQVKVREATSNDPWGPTTVLMGEIAELTYNPAAYNDIMTMLFKRLNDHVIRDFQHIEENRDQGLNVREKAKQIINLLKDEKKLKEERQKQQATQRKFRQQNFSLHGESSGMGLRKHSELEDARPASAGEEEIQLQIALALSREECEKEEEMRKREQMGLQIALEESKKEVAAGPSNIGGGQTDLFGEQINLNNESKSSKQQSTSIIDDLLSLNFGDSDTTVSKANNISTTVPVNNDPWAPSSSTLIPLNADPFVAMPYKSSTMDPWNSPSTILPSNMASSNSHSSDPWNNLPSSSDMPSLASNAAAHPEITPKFNTKTDTWADTLTNSSKISSPPKSNLQPLTSENNISFDPWNDLPKMNSNADILNKTNNSDSPWGEVSSSVLTNTTTSNVTTSNVVLNDPWSVPSEEVNLLASSTVKNDHNSSSVLPESKINQQRKNVKTPESFLGANSSLVNLDNLMGAPSTTTKTTNNPFLDLVQPTTPNPFHAQQGPSPSLNQMIQNQKPAAAENKHNNDLFSLF
ncbi:Liquid facets [Strongyloides ratti]|uniref:Liquid facets n=1 Tax=Strongyloides ratti TaxID=34506 RepID=A0A090KUJ8_STRRB|nr:Liquid facets [Strongyloides ratti]CEF61175.1 Liquid facets [Strongyloides ratti]